MKNIIGLLAFIILPLLAVAQGTIPFTPAVIFSGNNVRTLRSQIDINQQAFIRTGSDDPTVVATDGPQGSIYLRTGVSGGQFYTKQDAGVTTNWTQMAGGGSVASVALSLPSIFTVTGSPVTSTGTLTGTLIDQIANSVWAGPASGPNAPPTFRALVSADIPGLSAAKITSGQGTLSTSTSGVTVGSGINALLTSATIDVQTATGSQSGLLSAADWTTFNGKQSAGSYITALTGDVTAAGPGSSAATVVKIQGTAVSSTPPAGGQVLAYNNTSSQWEPGTAAATGASTALDNLTTTSINQDLTFSTAANITAPTQLQLNGGTGNFVQLYLFTGEIQQYTGTNGDGLASVYASSMTLQDDSGNSAPPLYFYDKGSGQSIGIRSPDVLSSSTLYQLPGADGNPGDVLRTNGSGVMSWVTPSGGGANTSLSNLASTAVNADLLPGSDQSLDFGSSSLRWRHIHAKSASLGSGDATSGTGALAAGFNAGSGTIISNHLGSTAYGYVDNSSTITASNKGALAHGNASDGTISATGEGSDASGLVVGGGVITASGNGAHASGFSVDGSTHVTASGGISFTHGFGTSTAGDFASSWGVGNAGDTYASFMVGRYGSNTGTTTSWVSTDPLFVVGNGANSGSLNNAFWIRKDGTLYIADPSLSGASVGYVWTLQNTTTGEGAWAAAGGGGGVTTMGAFGSSPNSNGGSISGVTLTLQPADGSNPGGVTTGTQTFAGAKTFSTSATSPIFSTSSAQPASVGNLRLSNGEAIGWRNSTNSSDKFISVDGGDNLLLSGAMKLTLTGSTTGQFRQGAAASTTTYAVVWPSAQGSADTFPRNDGSGNLTWVAPSVLAAQVKTTGTAPSVSSCGSSPSVAGNDSVGRITVGTGGVATSCTLTFNATWGTAPACTLGDETTALLLKGSASTTALTITVATPFGAGDTVVYHCLGY